MSVDEDQRRICEKHRKAFDPPSTSEKLGIALSTLHLVPLNGLRHRPENGTCGWYIWGGDLSDRADFFEPLHADHLAEHCPAVLPYLALPPGCRFLVAADGDDVWEDPSLLEV